MNNIEGIDQGKLESLGQYATRARQLEGEIEELNQALSKRQEELRIIIDGKMPEIMMEIGITEIKLVDGSKCILKDFYSASISPEHQEDAFKWLRENDHDSIIKNKIEAAFGKGEDAKVKELMEKLAPLGFTCKTSVHAMTLKSFVKELVEAGTPPPQDLFNLFIGKKVTIK